MTMISVVIPARNEAENIGSLIDEIDAACAAHGNYEVIVVDDGSDDGTDRVVRDRMTGRSNLRLIRHDRSGGQSAAIHSGVRAARGEIVCTLDGDGQNPPAEIPRLFAPLLAPGSDGVGLVAGQRVGRQDTFSRRMASKIANGIRSRLLRDGTRDTGCGLKAFRRDAFLALPYFDHMHRYLPALFNRDGWKIVHVDVGHRPRGAGRSKYSNLQRALVGIVDMVGVMWLIRRRKRSRPTEIAVEN
ncbi:glycosyltransferase involved in cell wall biosynthesis [Albidovulum inexpectatum]|uniref:Glycosyltransferase involved in cell wall biosynthesis n=1 Tax=Albidovulum inexpectatum TaxID=196587 RepID=A0A2S5JDR1_9RHOB|nr:glycosyltransferase family 2 protein [Albidovulum inexpectatum]PPB79603.1 glycosyltransferase involved in cell wall biosynthesis [Albidovulum inexpectatum]